MCPREESNEKTTASHQSDKFSEHAQNLQSLPYSIALRRVPRMAVLGCQQKSPLLDNLEVGTIPEARRG